MKATLTKHFWLLLAVGVSILALWPTLSNGLLFWDDTIYVSENPLIKDLSWEGIQNIFLTANVNSNYHPITILSWLFDYSFAGEDPLIYHGHNLFLHGINIGLVYILVYNFFGRIPVAFGVAILFGLHPMHVESVAWISARKDLLYAMYFLLSMMAYQRFAKGNYQEKKWLILTFLLFVFSLLSKGMAVMLPPVLLLIDYLHKRSGLKRMILEKLPFFAVAIGFGVLGYIGQSVALNNADELSYFDRIFVAANGVVVYLMKLIVPSSLSALHPYPDAFTVWFYIAIIPVLLLAWMVYKSRSRYRVLSFGLGFFAITLFPVSQLVPFGLAMHAERYTYIPYLGLMLVAMYYLDQWTSRQQGIVKTGLFHLVLGVCVLLFGVVSFQRSGVWKTDETLWLNVLETYPDAHFAMNNIGDYHFSNGQEEEALHWYNRTLELESRYYMVYNNRGMIHQNQGNLEEAEADFKTAVRLEPYSVAHLNLGVLYHQQERPKEAITAYSKAIQLDSSYALAYLNRGTLFYYTANYDKSVADLNQAKKLGLISPSLYIVLAKSYSEIEESELENETFKEAMEVYPNDRNIVFEKANSLFLKRHYKQAETYYELLLKQHPNDLNVLLNKAACSISLKDTIGAHAILNKVEELDSSNRQLQIYRNQLKR